MKRKLAVACALTLLALVVALLALAPGAVALVSTGDGSWFWRSPQPHGASLVSTACVGDTVWAVGDGGTIVVSNDGGATWSAQRSGTNLTLNAVVFLDGAQGWAAGGRAWEGMEFDLPSDNVILHTTDGGATWRRQRTPVDFDLYALEFTDALHGWAVGEEGVVLRTTDGGTTWVRRRTGNRTELSSVHFFDARRGWVAGSPGRMRWTADAGRTWRVVDLPRWARAAPGASASGGGLPEARGLSLIKPVFTDALHGYAVFGEYSTGVQGAGGPAVGVTGDGGRTWRRIARGADFTAVGAAPSAVWTCAYTRHGAVEYATSSDGGATWSRQTVNGLLADDIVSVGAAGACAVGFGGAFTASDGVSWIPRTSWTYAPSRIAASPGGLLGITEVWTPDDDFGYRCVTSADGATWRLAGDLGAFQPIAMQAADADHAIAAGATDSGDVAGPTLMATDDGGLTWTPGSVGSESFFFDVSYPDAQHAYACGLGIEGEQEVSLLAASTDGGRTWQRRTLPAGYIGSSIDFVSAQEGWAALIGETSSVLAHTLDGGVTWTKVPSTADPAAFISVDFSDALHGWAYGGDDTGSTLLLRTTDGGKTWVRAGVPEVSGLYGAIYGGLVFADPFEGWAWDLWGVGRLWHTADGGDTWQTQLTGASDVGQVEPGVDGDFAVTPWGVLSTVGLAGDTAAPYTYDDFDRAAHREPVSVRLTAGDVGGTVVSTEYKVDGADSWTPYVEPVVFEAPADHGNDGRHTLAFRSTDDSGNVESDYSVEVPIDTLGPSTAVRRSITVRRGAHAVIRLRVDDGVSRTARVTLRFKRLSDGRAARRVVAMVDTDDWQGVRFRAGMEPGRYRVTVEARDDAGNPQVHAGGGLLVVKPAGAGATAPAAATPAGRRDAGPSLVESVEARYGPLAAKLLAQLWREATGAGQSPRSARSWETVTKR